MSASSVEPMRKPLRVRDHDEAVKRKERRFHKKHVDNGKRNYLQNEPQERKA